MTPSNVIIRVECPGEERSIAEVHRRAFGRGAEARLVDAIRARPGFDPTLSLVATSAGLVVGHVLFSPIGIERGCRKPIDDSPIQNASGIANGAGVSPHSHKETPGVCDAPAIAALALAPMAVLPEFQRQGIGSQLVLAGLGACRAGGHRVVIVVGHAQYYPRFGFCPAAAHGLELPFPCPPEAFMALGLESTALEKIAGRVRYPAVFLECT